MTKLKWEAYYITKKCQPVLSLYEMTSPYDNEDFRTEEERQEQRDHDEDTGIERAEEEIADE